MRLVHESADGTCRTLATDVETADSLLAKTMGLMFRETVPPDYALVFRFEPGLIERLHERLPAPVDRLTATADHRNVHMLFVREPLDVLWLQDDAVVETETLRPWRGIDGASADTVVEMAAGAADGVRPGDTVRLVEDTDPVPGDATEDSSAVTRQTVDSDGPGEGDLGVADPAVETSSKTDESAE